LYQCGPLCVPGHKQFYPCPAILYCRYFFNGDIKPITREARVAAAQATIFALLNDKQKEFIEFVLTKYIETGVDELDQEKLPILLTNKYHSLEDAKGVLGSVSSISSIFIEFQKHLYRQGVA
jgi:type I restriction enzyme R subunit